MQPYRLFQAEEEVHVVDCLAARSLQQVVYHRNDQQLVFLFQQIDQALVRIYHLFQIRVLVGDESERVISVVFFINTLDPEVKANLIANNKTINWIPETIGTGRFGAWSWQRYLVRNYLSPG